MTGSLILAFVPGWAQLVFVGLSVVCLMTMLRATR